MTFWVDSFSQGINKNSSLSLSVHNHSQSFSRKLLILSPNSLLPITTVIYAKDKVEKILEGFLDLIPSPLSSVKIQIMGGKYLKIWRSIILFFFIFKFSIQNCISFWFLIIFWYLVLLFRNHLKHIEIFLLISDLQNKILKKGEKQWYEVL